MGDFVIEIKCPMTEETFKTYFDSTMTNPSSKFPTQVMLQMLFLNKGKGFSVWPSPTLKNYTVALRYIQF
ncbi:hypothetical protein WDU94_015559 [Cyamophila willieti]